MTGLTRRPVVAAAIPHNTNNNGRTANNPLTEEPARMFRSLRNPQLWVMLFVGLVVGSTVLPAFLVPLAQDSLREDSSMHKGSVYEPPGHGNRIDVHRRTADSTAAQRIKEDTALLATQSVPTATTPNVIRTPVVSDAERLKILVTGGAGFVGSHLVDKLMSLGHEVVVMDNFFTGQKRNIEHWLHHPNFSLVVHDVIEPMMLEVDQIYHLACPASPPHYQYNPVKTIKTSTMGTIHMLGLAKRVKARMLLTSTSEIYGDPEVHPQPESYWGNVNTIGPRSCYDEGKRVAETMMYSYRNQNSVDVRVARIFNTFGPRMHPNDGRVVSNFIIQSLQDKDLTIYGDGTQTRSFQYVSDLVDGLYALMNGKYDLPVNLGNPDEYSVEDFAKYIKDLTHSQSEIKFLPKSQDDPSQRKPDITTAKRELNWEPQIKVKDGLEKTIAYFKRVLAEAGEIIPTGPGAARPKQH
uniref:UDP-glucuronate decarboxylase n=1 Tax=Attheya septentrionalis TaxID=420275 RepID=A0A7S2XL72_9STRA|mmetsp:Transcript_17664/g.31904  ORF Transcript_17664/g.31904 Transcript_17664/m.31904 type:complete len:466 (+) Transcript_17664:83-1480(+)|eukprot:CAMPEP_0198286084 /NCGR_PEP_ID=MMETSP1449-20131203/5240_1 /TAXON_ID=420275 /ORGANISM="Attheya septentrionalis, Strain CCMP2084" /LENGTH=465 /DNA_ID=CAMNT_0043983715 /DNA_START=23 /DNA_END=1420 /DNA_ORIENTATION=-